MWERNTRITVQCWQDLRTANTIPERRFFSQVSWQYIVLMFCPKFCFIFPKFRERKYYVYQSYFAFITNIVINHMCFSWYHFAANLPGKYMRFWASENQEIYHHLKLKISCIFLFRLLPPSLSRFCLFLGYFLGDNFLDFSIPSLHCIVFIFMGIVRDIIICNVASKSLFNFYYHQCY